jgi:hypothetical protein
MWISTLTDEQKLAAYQEAVMESMMELVRDDPEDFE